MRIVGDLHGSQISYTAEAVDEIRREGVRATANCAAAVRRVFGIGEKQITDFDELLRLAYREVEDLRTLCADACNHSKPCKLCDTLYKRSRRLLK